MNLVAGKLNKALDHGGRYRKRCDQLAEDIGWQGSALFSQWKEITLLREFEQRMPRPLAEWFAIHDVRALFDKRGCQEPD